MIYNLLLKARLYFLALLDDEVCKEEPFEKILEGIGLLLVELEDTINFLCGGVGMPKGFSILSTHLKVQVLKNLASKADFTHTSEHRLKIVLTDLATHVSIVFLNNIHSN